MWFNPRHGPVIAKQSIGIYLIASHIFNRARPMNRSCSACDCATVPSRLKEPAYLDSWHDLHRNCVHRHPYSP
jgi:hypothetical protein